MRGRLEGSDMNRDEWVAKAVDLIVRAEENLDEMSDMMVDVTEQGGKWGASELVELANAQSRLALAIGTLLQVENE